VFKCLSFPFANQAPLDELQAAGGGKTLLDTVVETICDASHWPPELPAPDPAVMDVVQLKVCSSE